MKHERSKAEIAIYLPNFTKRSVNDLDEIDRAIFETEVNKMIEFLENEGILPNRNRYDITLIKGANPSNYPKVGYKNQAYTLADDSHLRN